MLNSLDILGIPAPDHAKPKACPDWSGAWSWQAGRDRQLRGSSVFAQNGNNPVGCSI
ncbi:MAG: hypothetical protein MUD08_05950 [Cytophagales bacterium]|nr:hypothetical protein [Cytophagales bacterium]